MFQQAENDQREAAAKTEHLRQLAEQQKANTRELEELRKQKEQLALIERADAEMKQKQSQVRQKIETVAVKQ